MSNSREFYDTLGLALWQQRILPWLDGHALLQFILTNKASELLARPVLKASKLALTVTRNQPDDALESAPKKRCLESDTAVRDLIDILRCMPVRYRSVIPYLLILALADKHAALFIQTILRLFNSQPRCYENIDTSCVNTTLLVLTMMIGFSPRLFIQGPIVARNITTAAFTVPLPSGTTWVFKVNNAFKADKKTINPCTLFHEKVMQQSHDLHQGTQDDANFMAAMKTFVTSQELMSAKVTDIRNHIHGNNQHTQADATFIYNIVLMNPSNICHHSFILEQFYCGETQSVRFRLYQSWVKESTLTASLQKHFSELPSRSWDAAGLYRFLTRLELYCSTSKPGYISDNECFGHGHRTGTRKFEIKFEDNTFSSCRVDYCSYKINPADCVNNLLDFVKGKPDLAAALAPK